MIPVHRSAGGVALFVRMIVLTPLLLAGLPTPARTQLECPGEDGASVRMEMLLEKTIFQVDVLTLTVRIGGPTGTRLRSLARTGATDEAADSAARIASGATCARSSLAFHRDISLDRFLEAIRESSRAAREADFITPKTFRLIDRSLPEWYAFLEGRGIEEGDRMTYRIRGDTLRIRYRSAEGRALLNRTDLGADRRRSVLAGYFAPGSDFRKGLLRSLFEEEAAGAASQQGRAAPGVRATAPLESGVER